MADKDHVIIKGWHDSGLIEAVYGPFTQAEAAYIHTQYLDAAGGYNWTVAKLTTFTEAAGDQPAKAPQREINNTAAVIQVRPNPDLDRRAPRPIGFGFRSPE